MSVLMPRDGEEGLYLDGFLEVAVAPVASQREIRVQLSLTTTFPAAAGNRVYDTLLTEADGVLVIGGADVWTVLIPVDRIGECGTDFVSTGASSELTYYLSNMTRTTGGVESAWATPIAVTFEAARLTRAARAEGA